MYISSCILLPDKIYAYWLQEVFWTISPYVHTHVDCSWKLALQYTHTCTYTYVHMYIYKHNTRSYVYRTGKIYTKLHVIHTLLIVCSEWPHLLILIITFILSCCGSGTPRAITPSFLTCRSSLWNWVAALEFGAGTSTLGHCCPAKNTWGWSLIYTSLPDMTSTKSVSGKVCW